MTIIEILKKVESPMLDAAIKYAAQCMSYLTLKDEQRDAIKSAL